MKIRIIFFIMVAAASVFGAREREKNLNPMLQKVEKCLQGVLEQLGDEVLIEYGDSSESLTIKYRTRKFIVHSASKIGKFSEDAHETIGPDFDGFMLNIYLQDAGIVNQAETPQTIRQPYWRTDLDVTQIAGTSKQIYWGLSYWSRADEKILSSIRKTIWELEGSVGKYRALPQRVDDNLLPMRKGDELTGLFRRSMKDLSPYMLDIDGGQSIALRGDILEDIPDGTRIWISGELHSFFYDNSSDPTPALASQWHIFMNVEMYEEITKPYEIPKRN